MLPTTKVVGFLWISFRILVLICWLKPSSFRKNSKIIANLYEPECEPRGVVVFYHGFTCKKEDYALIGTEFARQGILACLPDLRAHGNSEGTFDVERMPHDQEISRNM